MHPRTNSLPASGLTRPRPLPRPRSPILSAVLAVALASVTMGASCSMPAVQSSDISQGELMLQLSDALAGLRADDADLQAQIDSLRSVVARQDSALARLAEATGVSIR